MATATKTDNLVYDERIQMTEGVDFGIDLGSILSGAVKPPPEGARVDQSFVGSLEGPRLAGKISGTDFLFIRADGDVQVHAHAVLTTEDGRRIAVFVTGSARFTPGSPTGQVRENVTLHTAAPEYAWVNTMLVWATGSVDLSTGTITLKGYEA